MPKRNSEMQTTLAAISGNGRSTGFILSICGISWEMTEGRPSGSGGKSSSVYVSPLSCE